MLVHWRRLALNSRSSSVACYYNMPEYFATLTDPGILEAEDRQTVLFTLAFLVAILAFFAMLVYLAGRRWKEKESWGQATEEASL